MMHAFALAVVLLSQAVPVCRADLIITPTDPVKVLEGGPAGDIVFTVTNDGNGAASDEIIPQRDANFFPPGYTASADFYHGCKVTPPGGSDADVTSDFANVNVPTSTIGTFTGLDKRLKKNDSFQVTFHYTPDMGDKDGEDSGTTAVALLVDYRNIGERR